MREKIAVALKKLGPSAPGIIARELGEESSKVGYHIRAMEADKSLIAAGKGRGRIYGLPDQKLDGERSAPPQKHKQKKHRKAKHAPRRTAPPARATFIAAVDADSRLVLINGSEPQIFSEEQTEAIATLLFQHYKD